jgi:hypothetical protein
MRKTTRVLIIASVLLISCPALGRPLVKSHVSAGANWFLHADYEQFCNTQIGRLIRVEMKNEGIDEQLENFAAVFSFNPLKDIRGVTIYGNGSDKEKAVVLVDGTFDKEKLVSLVSMNPEHEEFKHGDIVIHGWVDENKRNADGTSEKMYGCFYGERLLVLSAGRQATKHAVDVLNGSAGSASGDLFNSAVLDAKGAFLRVGAYGLAKIVGQQPKAAMLKQAEELDLVVGEDGGSFYIDAGLKADSQEAAANISKMVDGVIAFAALAGEEQPKLAELAKKLKLSCVDKAVRVRFESDSRSVFEFLKEQWHKQKQEDQKKQ